MAITPRVLVRILSSYTSCRGGLGFFDDAFVEVNVLRNYLLGAVPFDRKFAALFSEGPAFVVVAEQAEYVLGHFRDVADIAKVAALAVVDDLRNSADPGRDHGQLARLGLKGGEPKRFEFRWQ